jgi:hypothetical protein
MYSKTRLGSDQIEGALSLSPRGKRIVYLIVAVLVAAGAAVGIWSGVSHDSLSGSGNGTVNVIIPSTTGGGTLHYSGAKAAAFCKYSWEHADHVSLLARPQCVDAGLTRAKVGG